MGGHVLDHLVLSQRRRFHELTKVIVFTTCLVTIFGVFWWFHKVSYGIEGPVGETWGLQWRKVRISSFRPSFRSLLTFAVLTIELEHLLSRVDGLMYLLRHKCGSHRVRGVSLLHEHTLKFIGCRWLSPADF
jgi:hypothetical protein